MSFPSSTVYRTAAGLLAQRGEDYFLLPGAELDSLFTAKNPAEWLHTQLAHGQPIGAPASVLPPVGTQEVWASGVTYLRSRDARMAESQDAGGGTFYDRVYAADRPELFFKATAPRVVPHGGTVCIRNDATWNVPEPEVVLAINRHGQIFGYTVGNDMSSRDIEGENPLYLPQAKVYRGSCALGPGLVVREPLPGETAITVKVHRGGSVVFQGETAVNRMKRQFPELAEWLFRDNDFPTGAYLFTGTGIIPPDNFTLAAGDEVEIHIESLGTLRNPVALA